MGLSNRGPNGIGGALSTNGFIMPSTSPEMMLASGTWKHPSPGNLIPISIFLIGGGGGGRGFNTGSITSGGGGGSGRILITTVAVTADQVFTSGTAGIGGGDDVNGTSGGASTFGALSAAGGSGATSAAGFGGSGGFGGGGGANGGGGGAGLDFIGGGGGYGNNIAAGTSAYGGMFAKPGDVTAYGGWPNGGFIAQASGGLGGDPLLLFPFTLGFGAGGKGSSVAGTSGTNGKPGAAFIWINRL